jgi:Radical SAM superfamily/4Fe-4S single cluster domain
MLVRPHTLSLITTHQCTAACDHCCFNCTPKIIDAIPVNRLHTLIDEAAELGTIQVIVFTGGECFLLGTDLYELIAHAKRNGFVTRCVTNGYWGTAANAQNVVDSLVSAGLDEINFSTGEEHASYVPADRVRVAALACNNAGIRVLINIELFNDTSFGATSFIGSDGLCGAVESKAIRVQRNVWIEGDGARPLAHRREHSRFSPDRIGGCHTALSVLAVTPKQSLVACCGLHMERIPELHLGSIKEESLLSLTRRVPDDFLKIWIHVEGPERILQFVKSKVPEYRLPEESVHPCTTCLHLYKDDVARATIVDHYSEVESRVSNLYLAGLTKDEVARSMRDISFGDC